MAKPEPKDVWVDVHIDNPDSKPPLFHFTSKDLTVGPNNVLTFNNNGHPGFYVHYRLVDPRHGYTFPGPAINGYLDEALYSKVGKGCPDAPPQWGQFTAYAVNGTTLELTVWNKNESNADFAYTLRVTKDGGANYLPLDPGGINNNGPSGRLSPAVLIAVAVAVVAIAALVLYKLNVFGTSG